MDEAKKVSQLRQKVRAGCAFTTPPGEWEKIDAEIAALEARASSTVGGTP